MVDANVAIGAALPENLFLPTTDASIYNACFAFMSRATYHNAELHIPYLFYSEVANAIGRDAIAKGLVDRPTGTLILQAALGGADWIAHLPDWARVYEINETLRRTHSFADAEYLAVAEALGCELITAYGPLSRSAAQSRLKVPVVEVRNHPWASDGPIGAFPSSEPEQG